MYGSGFTETLSNPNPGELRMLIKLPTRSFTIWHRSHDDGDEWVEANVYIGELCML